MTDEYTADKLRLNFLRNDINERKVLLETLSSEHWLYDIQKKQLDERKKEYADLDNFLKREGVK